MMKVIQMPWPMVARTALRFPSGALSPSGAATMKSAATMRANLPRCLRRMTISSSFPSGAPICAVLKCRTSRGLVSSSRGGIVGQPGPSEVGPVS